MSSDRGGDDAERARGARDRSEPPLADGDLDPAVTLDAPASAGEAATQPLERASARTGGTPDGDDPAAWSRYFRRLRLRGNPGSRYAVRSLLGRGGMGAVFAVWDEDLRRHLAMKVIRGAREREALPPRVGSTPPPADGTGGDAVDPGSLGRFLEEAQITGQLHHPGIVPVHEVGLDADGRVYFTMRLVRGATFAQVIEWAWSGENGFNRTRAVSVLVDVCDALAYAHAKGVVHRDLKPGNVMVGRFGETYVMDWGLARVLGHQDRHDLRLRPPDSASLRTERSDVDESRDDSPIVTMDGAVVGTPAYMPPEQAFGRVERIDRRSDVYSVGAMLYHLLTRRMPYVEPGARVSQRTLLAMVQMGPPRPIHAVCDDVPAELAAICEKAMARDPGRRYADTREMAEDLRAYLEHRVVRAHATGALAELRKWVERNRALAASLAAAVLLAVGGSALFAWQSHLHGRELAKRNVATEAARADAEGRLAEVKRLADVKRVRDLQLRAEELWPARPARVAAMEAWVADAGEVVGRLDLHRRSLEQLRGALPSEERAAARFGDVEMQWWHDQLVELVAAVETLARPVAVPDDVLRAWRPSKDEEPPAAAFVPADSTLAAMRRRIEHAAWIEELSLDAAVDAWNAAVGRVAVHPRYGGLQLKEQLGLVPIGSDPQSGLEEFWDVATGAPPRRDEASGRWAVEGSTGLIYVLLPGGRFTMGTRPPDGEHPVGSPHVDPDSKFDEQPPQEVELAPFLISKFEMTQAQWLRAEGANPSWFTTPGLGAADPWTRPVETVSWTEAARLTARIGASLPSEAQWEYAARAGTTTIWWCGDDRPSIARAGNVADAAFRASVRTAQRAEPWDDAFEAIAPVGRFAPNGFGLHDVLGNVWELCADEFVESYRRKPARRGDGLRAAAAPGGPRVGVVRGGGWNFGATLARSAERNRIDPSNRTSYLGLRPVRALAE